MVTLLFVFLWSIFVTTGDTSKGVASYLQAKEAAVQFIKKFASETEYFTGGDVLEAFRNSGLPGSELDWRNRWGGLISSCNKVGLLVRAGRVAPTSKQSHTDSLTLWKSRLYSGPQSLTHKDHAAVLVSELRRKVLCREMSIEDAFWKMYERGWVDHSNEPIGQSTK